MGLALVYLPGKTPLDEDEADGLLIPSITTKAELDEFEQKNIEDAIQWSLTRNFKQKLLLTEAFVKEVHKRMYKDVWAWAGSFRTTNKNLGVDKWQIATELKMLLDDMNYCADNKIYAPDELATRFKHRIVSIHCFSNGNGRHSRLMADIIIDKMYGEPVFSWGANDPSDGATIRQKYLKAIRAADMGDHGPLLVFARS